VTFEIGLVIGILLIAVVLFVTEKLRVDVVALMVLVALALTGLLEPKEALSGFSNPAVITVWAVFILSGGLARTGVAGILGRQVLRLAGSGEVRLIALIMLTSAFLSAFMNNVGVAALLLPVVMDISKRTAIAPSKLLMPLAASSLLGGLTTGIGTPPNILITEALYASGRETFGLFDFLPVGSAVVVGGILFMVLVGRRMLPDRDPVRQSRGAGKDLRQIYSLSDDLSMLHLPDDSALDGKSLAESLLGSALGLNVVCVFRGKKSLLAPGPDTELRAGDRLLVEGTLEQLAELRGKEYLAYQDENLAVERLISSQIEVAEVRCTPGCPMLGRTLRELDFRRKWGAIVLAIQRGEISRRTGLENVSVEPGDVLLVQGTPEQLDSLSAEPHVEVRRLQRAAADFELEHRLMAVKVPEDSALAGKTLAESRLGAAFGLGVMGIVRGGETRLMPRADEQLLAGDTLLIKGRRESLASVEGLRGLEVDEEAPDLEALESDRVGLAEAVLSPRSSLAGRTLRDLHFREKYGLNVVAISRGGEVLRSGLRDLALRFGDALLLHGPRQKLRLLGTEPDFLVLTEEAQEPVELSRAPIAALLMAGVVGSVIAGIVPIYIAAVTGAVLMVLTRCLSMDDAYRSIEWKAVFLIAGMLPLGMALEKTGAARYLTDQVIALIGEGSPLLIVAGLYIVTALGAQVMPTAAVAILMAPIALNTATDLGLSPYALMMTVALSASASFMSPVAHPANVLIMGPGGYRFSDYIKVGLPLTLVCLAVVLLVLPLFWPLTP
jgi:di/tricarboxylate transporter